MSIAGAVAELNKEIERLTLIRDSLLQAPSGVQARGVAEIRAKKSASAKKSIGSERPAPATRKKRVLSAAAKKRISDAQKARWAAAKKPTAAK